MQFISAYHTDKGIRKSVNQDSLYLAEARTPLGLALLAVICDGLGGLARGELASAELTRAFASWFNSQLPTLVVAAGSREAQAGSPEAQAGSLDAASDSPNKQANAPAALEHDLEAQAGSPDTQAPSHDAALPADLGKRAPSHDAALATDLGKCAPSHDSSLAHALEQQIKDSWEALLASTNERMLAYAARNNLQLGTAVVALLLVADSYYAINIGDSRVYLLADDISQLTSDHTVVQREIDLGVISREQAESDPRRNVLLQCVGATTTIQPEFRSGRVAPGEVFLLCSDGFRHKLSQTELYERLNRAALTDARQMTDTLVNLTELNMQRREQDNISSILVKVI
jgi:serine/threonine protein phosphatase PrpC